MDRQIDIQQRILKTRTADQVIRLKYILSHSVIKHADLPIHQSQTALGSIESFVRSFYPFPQDLGIGAINKVLEDPDVYTKIIAIYSRAQIIRDQRKLMQELREEPLKARRNAALQDPSARTEFGWRAWDWDPERKMLRSPVQTQYTWEFPELRVEKWDTDTVVEGRAGIHARLMPMDWTIAMPDSLPFVLCRRNTCVTGVVERFGKFVLGEIGWRAEWVIIRKLLAQDQELGFQLEMAYPDVAVVYYDRTKYGAY